MAADDNVVEDICQFIIEKHNSLVKKRKAQLKKDPSKATTPLWMQDWEQPVLIYRSDGHLTLEDVVHLVLQRLERT